MKLTIFFLNCVLPTTVHMCRSLLQKLDNSEAEANSKRLLVRNTALPESYSYRTKTSIVNPAVPWSGQYSKGPGPGHQRHVFCLIVPDFTISVYSSSCNSLFLKVFFLFSFFSIYFLAFHSASGKSTSQVNAKGARMTPIIVSYMNCRKHKWLSLGL